MEEKPPFEDSPEDQDKGYEVAPDDDFGSDTPDAGVYPAPSGPRDLEPLPEGIEGIPSEEEDEIAAQEARNNQYPPDPDDGGPKPAVEGAPDEEDDFPLRRESGQ